jgi:hypothetical protein
MRSRRVALPLLSLLMALAAVDGVGEGKSYFTLVGELIGIVDTPRYLRDACSRRLPDARQRVHAAYASWRERHAALLARVDEQVRRADARARRQGSSFTATDFGEAGAQRMHEQMRGVDLAQARGICSQYETLLEEKDEAMAGVVPARLAAIEDADRRLSVEGGRP